MIRNRLRLDSRNQFVHSSNDLLPSSGVRSRIFLQKKERESALILGYQLASYKSKAANPSLQFLHKTEECQLEYITSNFLCNTTPLVSHPLNHLQRPFKELTGTDIIFVVLEPKDRITDPPAVQGEEHTNQQKSKDSPNGNIEGWSYRIPSVYTVSIQTFKDLVLDGIDPTILRPSLA